MSGRNPPSYCTLTLIAMQGHQQKGRQNNTSSNNEDKSNTIIETSTAEDHDCSTLLQLLYNDDAALLPTVTKYRAITINTILVKTTINNNTYHSTDWTERAVAHTAQGVWSSTYICGTPEIPIQCTINTIPSIMVNKATICRQTLLAHSMTSSKPLTQERRGHSMISSTTTQCRHFKINQVTNQKAIYIIS